jgi:hypothetical protein
MKLFKITLMFIVVFAGYLINSCQVSHADSPPVNIALGKTVTLSMPSTESYTLDKNPSQLTDGKYAGDDYDSANKSSTLWLQKGALTWRIAKDPVVITIDLGKTMPISGVSFSTAAGGAGVNFPSLIAILVSEDAKLWHYKGNLINLARKNGVPNPDGYSKFRFTTHDLKTKGRYLSLAIKQSPYTVTDEIEVYKGDNSWLDLPAGGPKFSSLDTVLINENVQRRVSTDIQAIRQILAESSLSHSAKSTFTKQLDESALENDAFALEDKDIKTILPINNIHRAVMAIYGEVLAAEGVAPFTVWKQHRYAWLPFITKPSTNDAREINIEMLKNEFRSDALLLTNASSKEKIVTLQLENLPSNAKDGWLKISSVAWTDTYQGIPVADALLPVPKSQEKYSITVPAGFTSKVWFTVDASKVGSGNFRSNFIVDNQKVPFNLSVSKLAMQRPRMSLTVWDNSDDKSIATGVTSRGITAQNKNAALAMMKSHFVDAPWADRPILPWPKAEDFDAQNELKTPLDFSDFDKWIAEWPQARTFFVFINAKEKETFGGGQRGTAEFNARLGVWAKVLSSHMKELGLRPQQLSLLIIDEPGFIGDWQDDVISDWARAIHASAPELSLVSDPYWKRPDLQKNQEAITRMNILYLSTSRYSEASEYFQKQRTNGTELRLYDTDHPVRLINPQHYYRGSAWRVFSVGGTGMGFWAFNDTRGAPTAWNDYQISMSFAPAFLDKDTVYNSIHWDSVREGVEDFEELAMLQDAIKTTRNAELKTKAQIALDEAVKVVTATKTNDPWNLESDPGLVDQQLQKVRKMLNELSG